MAEKQKIYLIGGLGVDERVFNALHFHNLEKHVVYWIEPLPWEKLQDYCKRLLPQIDSPDPIIAGVSFGGMIANEISRLINVRQIFLISSIRSAKEMSVLMRISGVLKLHKLIPVNLARKAHRILRWAFWVYDPEHKKLLEKIAEETDPVLIRWSLNQVVNWKGEESKNTYQIHGDKDRTFPISKLKHPDIVLKGTGHFMVVQRADEIAKIIEGVVEQLN